MKFYYFLLLFLLPIFANNVQNGQATSTCNAEGFCISTTTQLQAIIQDVVVKPEVQEGLQLGLPIVALESTIISHGIT